MLEDDWLDFGQKERVTVRLKELIRNYPRGIGIIKELIQNADDAGAQSLSVLLVLRLHPAGRVPDTRMNIVIGPALVIANKKRVFATAGLRKHSAHGRRQQDRKRSEDRRCDRDLSSDRSDAHPGVSIEVRHS